MKFQIFILLFFILSLSQINSAQRTSTRVNSSRSFSIDYDRNTFKKDGKAFRYVSGSIHYFRSTEQQWEDLLRKCRLAGLNAITTYISWNLHQPTPSAKFNYDGNLNFFKFLEIAQKNDLLVILRPAPFIDAEFDMGGLPAWLLMEKPDMKLRTSDPDYVYFVSRWYDELLPRLAPFLYENGGPIIMMQIENEYGSYACDKEYTGFLRNLIHYHLGNDIVLFTTDGASDSMVKCGHVDGCLATVDFGTEDLQEIESSFDIQRKYAPKGPLVNSEFYPGWLDHWQKPHSKIKPGDVSDALNYILQLGANVNIYMFHGGTSFGYWAGANLDGKMYDPCPTSYDYDAPLTEAGDPTDKYFSIKNTIKTFMEVPKEDPVVSPKGAYGKVVLEKLTSLFADEFVTIFGGLKTHSVLPKSFEELGVSSGFVLYQTHITQVTPDPVELSAPELKDRAYIYVDKIFQGIISRQEGIFSIPIRARKGQVISLLVENQGRICYGSGINESKGPGQNVTLGSTILRTWEMFPFGELDGKKLTKYSNGLKAGNVNNNEDALVEIRNGGSGSFFVGNFTIPASDGPVLDTFVRLDGFNKGLVWVNGFNLGRYWPIVGPQITLYLPAPILRPNPETNTFLVFELEGAPDQCLSSFATLNNQILDDKMNECFINLTDTHIIDSPTPFKASKPLFKN